MNGPPGSAPQAYPGPSSSGPSIAGFREIFAGASFRRLFWAQAISSLGDWVGTLAFIAAAHRLSGGKPLAVTVVLLLRLIPTVVAAPFGGMLADRLSRRAVMIVGDIVRCGIVAVTPLFPNLAALYALAFVHEAMSLVFLPARDASIPNVVPLHRLEAANAAVMGSSFAALPLSGPIYGLLAWASGSYPESWTAADTIHKYPYALAFAFDALTFALSALMLRRLRLPSASPAPADVHPPGSGFRAGIDMIRATPVLRSLACAVFVAMLGGGVLFSLGIGYVEQTLGGDDAAFGWLMGLFGAGMAGGFVVSQARRHHAGLLRRSVTVTGLVLVVMGGLAQLWLAYLMAVVFGAAFGIAVILAMSRAQAATPDDVRGRVMAAVHVLYRSALIAGALGSGLLSQALGNGVRLPGTAVSADANQIAMAFAGGLIVIGSAAIRAER